MQERGGRVGTEGAMVDTLTRRIYRKAVKEIEKAARKDSKNLAKLRKDLEKYRDKASTEAFAELCGLLLELLPEGE